MQGFTTYDLSPNGDTLATRLQGQQAAAAVKPLLARRQAVLLNFVGVEVATPSFFEDFLAEVRAALAQEDQAPLAIAGLGEELRKNLLCALGPQQMGLTELGD